MAYNDVKEYGYYWREDERRMIHFPSFEIPRLSLCESTKVQRYRLGTLDRLPLEILHQLLGQLDFLTLLSFRGLNLASRSIIDSLLAFKYMTQYAANVLRAINRTNLITTFTAAHLLKSLRTDRCTGCQQFGSYLFLLTCSRCCYDCLQKEPRFRAIDLATARKDFGLKPKSLRGLPTMLSLPGIYAPGTRRSFKRRFRLVSAVEAYTLAKALNGSVTTAAALDSTQSETNAYSHDRAWASMLTSSLDSFRGFASIVFPSLDTRTMRVESGISCKGCRAVCNVKNLGSNPTLVTQRERAFSLAEFQQHISECDGVRRLRDLSQREEVEIGNYRSRRAFIVANF